MPSAPIVHSSAQTAFAAIVFDMDGVLVHSAPCHSAAFETVLKRHFGITDFRYPRFAGWRTRDVIETVVAEHAIETTPEAISTAAAEKTRLALELIESSPTIVPGIAELLTELRNSGFILALASSGSPQSIESFLKNSSTSGMFRSVLTGADVSRAKPDPEIYTRTFEALGIEPHKCLVVEDAVAGITAVIAAGASAVGVAGTSPDADLLSAGALTVLPGVPHLPTWLNHMYAAA